MSMTRRLPGPSRQRSRPRSATSAARRHAGDDPCQLFCKSGLPATRCGIRCIATELSEEYCERAAERCRQETLDLGGVA